MKIRPLFIHASIIGLVFLGQQAFQAKWLQGALVQQDETLISRLGVGMANALNEAHRTKDDLALINLLSGITQAPGVLQAFVIDSNNRIIAHRQPVQLGRLVSPAPSGSAVYLYPLRLGSKEWGRLLLSISGRFNRQLIRRQWLTGLVTAALLWGCLFLYLQLLERRTSLLHVQVTELDGLLQAERRKWNAFQERERLNALQSAACLRKAVEGIPQPLMVLDLQQRISAVNLTALSRLGVTEPGTILGKSWQEIPALAAAGMGLERSLAFPGQLVDWSNEKGDLRLTFETDKDGLAGTWISFQDGTCTDRKIVLEPR